MDRFPAIHTIVLAMTMTASTVMTAPAEANSAQPLRPYPAAEAPSIDGRLDDAVWQKQPLVAGRLISYWPHQGTSLPFLTEVWAAYDEENLYFAFFAHDDEPEKIKSSITRRDNIVPEDWVGVLVNASGNRHSGYGFYSNPNGIQYDELVTANGEDADPDWVWYSEAELRPDGYTVEMRIPLTSISYQSGDEVRMCLTFFRQVSRLGYVTSWPTIEEGSNSLRAAADAIYASLRERRRFEVLPTVTYSTLQSLHSPRRWSAAVDETQFGVDLNFGVTSSISADITYNPDFSQVESDTFQILVNQRYPVFFEEKRPFFMELSNQFNLARSPSSNLFTAVHTRRISDPAWGTKIRGELGKFSFGVLGAEDEAGRLQDSGADSPLYLMQRTKYSLGGDSFIGILYSGLEQNERYNRVFASDLLLNLAERHTIRGNVIYTASRDAMSTFAPHDPKSSGSAYHLDYVYSTRPLNMEFLVEHFDENFRMDTAFYNRTGITAYKGFVGPSFYPGDRLSWIDRVRPSVYAEQVRDDRTGLDDRLLRLNLWLGFPRQGTFVSNYSFFEEAWMGQIFEGSFLELSGGVQANNWLRFDTYARLGDRVLYDPERPMMGDSRTYRISSTLQLSKKLRQFFSYTYQDLDDPVSNEQIYDVTVLTSRTEFQVNKYLFFRASVQQDSSRDLLLTDLLASFTLIPGTVLHVGYGSMYEDKFWNDDHWLPGHPEGRRYQTSKSLFFKASYRWQQ